MAEINEELVFFKLGVSERVDCVGVSVLCLHLYPFTFVSFQKKML